MKAKKNKRTSGGQEAAETILGIPIDQLHEEIVKELIEEGMTEDQARYWANREF